MGWEELPEFLSRFGVKYFGLEKSAQFEAEAEWRSIYSPAFAKSSRIRAGFKAEFEYSEEGSAQYLIVPFTSDVPGIPMDVSMRAQRLMMACQCEGSLVPLGPFCNAEFFVSPLDFSWTIVHTHEDHAFGGPYFVRREWVE